MRARVDSIAVGFRNDVEPLWFGCLFSQTLQAASALGLSPYDCETSSGSCGELSKAIDCSGVRRAA